MEFERFALELLALAVALGARLQLRTSETREQSLLGPSCERQSTYPSEATNLPRAGAIPLPPVWKNNESAAVQQRHCPTKRGELLVLPKSFHHTLVLTLSYEPLVAL